MEETKIRFPKMKGKRTSKHSNCTKQEKSKKQNFPNKKSGASPRATNLRIRPHPLSNPIQTRICVPEKEANSQKMKIVSNALTRKIKQDRVSMAINAE